MLPVKVKSLIDKYCMGVKPSDTQMDEITDLCSILEVDFAEASAYMKQMIAGPTKEEREADERAKAEKAKRAAEAKAEAERKAREESERVAKEKAAAKAKVEAERKAKEEAERKAKEAAKEKEDAYWRNLPTIEQVANELVDSLVPGFKQWRFLGKNKDVKVCKYLVTQRQWNGVWYHFSKSALVAMGETPDEYKCRSLTRKLDASTVKGDNFPITGIDREGVKEFIQAINEVLATRNIVLELPNDGAQWNEGFMQSVEKEIGPANKEDYCWFANNSEGKLHEVGLKKPVLGIYDALGLVYEMTSEGRNGFDSRFGGCYSDRLPYITAKVGKVVCAKEDDIRDRYGFRLVQIL